MLDERQIPNVLKIFFPKLFMYLHLLNVFFVILAFIKPIGIFFFFAKKIRLGQISESTRKIALGDHKLINFSIMKYTSTGKNL